MTLKEFFTKLQQADEPTRKKWALILSGTAMAAAVVMWIVYMNMTVLNVPSPASEERIAQKSAPKESGLLDTLGAGLSRIIAQFKTKLAAKRNIVIQNQDMNFIVEDLEEIPQTKLP